MSEGADLGGDCPNCGEEVDYSEWMEGESDELKCPECGAECDVDDVFPEA